MKDHPRLCGEKNFIRVHRVRQSGSPPPMRGKDIRRRVIEPFAGITPAYAGKSETGSSRVWH